MSSKKDKILESAQKFIAKGQLDRAIKDYEQIVSMDPNDIRHRQRLAELLVRVNRKDEAIGEYEAIGKYYADNLYYLKAIAVYKQVQKLDPDNIKICLHLATLNEKQGLTGNALAEYSRVYSHYEKTGKRTDALTILESMIALDPDNLNTRLKFAESRFASGGAAAAYDDFLKLALLLHSRGDENAFKQVCERVVHLYPDRPDFLLDILAARLGQGDAAPVVATLQQMLAVKQDHLPGWQLLVKALRADGGGEPLKVALQKMAKLFPSESSPVEELAELSARLDPSPQAATVPLSSAVEAVPSPDPEVEPEDPQQPSLETELDISLDMDTFDAESAAVEAEAVATPPVAAQHEVAVAEQVPDPAPSPDFSDIDIELDLSDDYIVEVGILAGEPDLAVPEPETTDSHAVKEVSEVEEAASEEEAGSPPGEAMDEIDLELPEEMLAGIDIADPAAEPFPGQSGEDPDVPGDEDSHSWQEIAGDEAVDEMDLELELPEEMVDVRAAAEPGDQCFAEVAGESGDLSFEEVAVSFGDWSDAGLDVPHEEPAANDLVVFADHDLIELDGEISFQDDPAQVSPQAGSGYAVGSSSARKGLDQQMDQEDTETHYNLGIAFKEMGLYDDAIAEFQAASRDPGRTLDCIILQGMCCRDKGDMDRAEQILKQGISLGEKGAVGDESSPLKYELALMYESVGRDNDARALYREIYEVAPDFRDTREKVAGVHEAAELYDDLDLLELEGEEDP